MKVYTCPRCGTQLPYDDPARITEHRLGHLADDLMGADDHALFDMSGDPDPILSFSNLPDMVIYPIVSQEDVAPVLAGVDRLLKYNLPWARRAVQEDK